MLNSQTWSSTDWTCVLWSSFACSLSPTQSILVDPYGPAPVHPSQLVILLTAKIMFAQVLEQIWDNVLLVLIIVSYFIKPFFLFFSFGFPCLKSSIRGGTSFLSPWEQGFKEIQTEECRRKDHRQIHQPNRRKTPIFYHTSKIPVTKANVRATNPEVTQTRKVIHRPKLCHGYCITIVVMFFWTVPSQFIYCNY